MAIRVITDSASDINQRELENVTVVPLTVTIGDKTYRDGVDLSKDEFYRKLEEGDAIPVTSLASPYQFGEVYDTLKDEDEAIVITLSSELSGTYQSAVIATEGRTNISVIDSQTGSAAQKLLVIRALEMISEGKSRSEIVETLEKEKNELSLYAVVDTLKFLSKSGRVSLTSAFLGGILGIKPILEVKDGQVVPIGKVRGIKQSCVFVNQKISERGGIDYTRPYLVGYSGTEQSKLQLYLDASKELLEAGPNKPDTIQIGSTIGTHSGPGAYLIAFFRNH